MPLSLDKMWLWSRAKLKNMSTRDNVYFCALEGQEISGKGNKLSLHSQWQVLKSDVISLENSGTQLSSHTATERTLSMPALQAISFHTTKWPVLQYGHCWQWQATRARTLATLKISQSDKACTSPLLPATVKSSHDYPHWAGGTSNIWLQTVSNCTRSEKDTQAVFSSLKNFIEQED